LVGLPGPLLFWLPFFVIYLIPLIVAIYRQTDNIFIVGLLNVFTGGTIVGWGVALYLALKAPRYGALAPKR
jgi:hypothetical protein